MFNKKSLKLGLTGAILFIVVGSFTACSESPTDPINPQYAEGDPVCTIVNGQVVCK